MRSYAASDLSLYCICSSVFAFDCLPPAQIFEHIWVIFFVSFILSHSLNFSVLMFQCFCISLSPSCSFVSEQIFSDFICFLNFVTLTQFCVLQLMFRCFCIHLSPSCSCFSLVLNEYSMILSIFFVLSHRCCNKMFFPATYVPMFFTFVCLHPAHVFNLFEQSFSLFS